MWLHTLGFSAEAVGLEREKMKWLMLRVENSQLYYGHTQFYVLRFIALTGVVFLQIEGKTLH